MQKNNPKTKRLLRLTISAMLIALSTVIGIVCKDLFTFGLFYRLTFENLPVIFASLVFGPIYGAAVGLCEDVISCLCSTNPAVNPIITLGALSVGLVSGLVGKLIKKEGLTRILASAGAGHLIGQVLIKSVGKIVYFHMPAVGILVGLGFSIVMCAVEVTVIYILLKNKYISKYMVDLK